MPKILSPNQFPAGFQNTHWFLLFPLATFNYQRDDHLFGREVARYHDHYGHRDYLTLHRSRGRLIGIGGRVDLSRRDRSRGSIKLHKLRCSSTISFLFFFRSPFLIVPSNRESVWLPRRTSIGINVEFLLMFLTFLEDLLGELGLRSFFSEDRRSSFPGWFGKGEKF